MLVRLSEVASQNNLTELANRFHDALTRELGTWDSADYDLLIEPKNDAERLYVAAVLSVLRNPQYADVLPALNKALSGAATKSIQILELASRKISLQQTARDLVKAGKTADEIAAQIEIPVEEVRKFLNWVRFEELLCEHRRPQRK